MIDMTKELKTLNENLAIAHREGLRREVRRLSREKRRIIMNEVKLNDEY